MTKEVMEVRKACVSVGKCEKAVRKTQGEAPLFPMQIVWEPFGKVAVDIIDHLSRTKSGN